MDHAPPPIFISYRRSDAAGYALVLGRCFDGEAVFFDYDEIHLPLRRPWNPVIAAAPTGSTPATPRTNTGSTTQTTSCAAKSPVRSSAPADLQGLPEPQEATLAALRHGLSAEHPDPCEVRKAADGMSEALNRKPIPLWKMTFTQPRIRNRMAEPQPTRPDRHPSTSGEKSCPKPAVQHLMPSPCTSA